MAVDPSGVLEHLKALSPNHIYFLAPKAFVLRGYEYYAQGRLESYSWNHSRTILAASVRGSKYYAVTFSLQNGQLDYSCRCPAWTASTQCKHVICALLTTVNLLVPDTFRVATMRKTSHKELSHQLLQGASASPALPKRVPNLPSFEVALVDYQGQGSIVITNHGKVCQTFLGMPTELAVLLRATQDPAWSVADALRDFLSHHGQAFPIYFENSQGRTLVEWAPSMIYTIKTELDIRGEEVLAAARCLRFGVVQEFAQLFMGMVVDLGAKKLAPLDDEQGWTFYDAVADLIARADKETNDPLPPQTFFSRGMRSRGKLSLENQKQGQRTDSRPVLSIPVSEFASLQIDLPRKELSHLLKTIQLRIQGQEAELVHYDSNNQGPFKRHRLTVMAEAWLLDTPLVEPNTSALVAECWQGEDFSGTNEQIFSVFPFLEQGRLSSSSLRTKKTANGTV